MNSCNKFLGVSISVFCIFLVSLHLFKIANQRLIAQCIPVISDKIQVCVSKDFSLWLANPTDQKIDLESGELFGYNVGQYDQKPLSGPGFAHISIELLARLGRCQLCKIPLHLVCRPCEELQCRLHPFHD